MLVIYCGNKGKINIYCIGDRGRKRMSKYHLDLLWNNQLFNIEYRKYIMKESMPETHYHPHYEIYYQLSGDRYYFIKDRTYHIQEGSLVLLNREDIHRTFSADKNTGERILINFGKEFLGGIKEPWLEALLSCFSHVKGVLQLNLSQKKEIEILLYKMIEENKREKDTFYNQLLLGELLSLSSRYIKEVSNEEVTLVHSSAKHERIAKVAKYLNENYSQKVTLEEVAKVFYISPYYLSRTFKEGTGFNMINYLNYIRVKNAKVLLDSTSRSVMDISEEVGFESTTHFDRVFKEIEGISPLKYRKQTIDNYKIK